MDKIIFLTWAKTVPRSKNIGKHIGADCHFIEYFKHAPKIFLPVRYGLQALKTIQVLLRSRPRIVITANPPIILPLLAYGYVRLFGGKLVIDSHTGAFDPKGWGKLISLHKYLSRHALITIVTNRPLSLVVKGWRASVFVLEDALPDFVSPLQKLRLPGFSVCVINSFSEDEPLEEILEAAEKTPQCHLYITGKIPKGSIPITEKAPKNVHFTGFLPDSEYRRLLFSVDAIMVLVKYDMTMLCGAYEAVAAGKPLITSGWGVLRNYFSRGALYVDNSPASIASALTETMVRRAHMVEEMGLLKKEIKAGWNASIEKLIRLLARS